MKGPKIVKYYSCEHCDENSDVGMNLSQCNIIPNIKYPFSGAIMIWNYKTPDECTCLIKKQRKEKLEKINETKLQKN